MSVSITAQSRILGFFSPLLRSGVLKKAAFSNLLVSMATHCKSVPLHSLNERRDVIALSLLFTRVKNISHDTHFNKLIHFLKNWF